MLERSQDWASTVLYPIAYARLYFEHGIFFLRSKIDAPICLLFFPHSLAVGQWKRKWQIVFLPVPVCRNYPMKGVPKFMLLRTYVTRYCTYIQVPVLTGKQHLCDLLAGANYHADLINKAVGRWGDLSFFLGGRSLEEEPWTPDINVVRSTIKFAQLTKRLNLLIRNSSSAGVSYDTTHHTTAPSLTNVRSGPCLIYRW